MQWIGKMRQALRRAKDTAYIDFYASGLREGKWCCWPVHYLVFQMGRIRYRVSLAIRERWFPDQLTVSELAGLEPWD